MASSWLLAFVDDVSTVCAALSPITQTVTSTINTDRWEHIFRRFWNYSTNLHWALRPGFCVVRTAALVDCKWYLFDPDEWYLIVPPPLGSACRKFEVVPSTHWNRKKRLLPRTTSRQNARIVCHTCVRSCIWFEYGLSVDRDTDFDTVLAHSLIVFWKEVTMKVKEPAMYGIPNLNQYCSILLYIN